MSLFVYHVRRCTVVLVFLEMATAVSSIAAPLNGVRWGVIVGVDRGSDIAPSLHYAVSDARRLCQTLESMEAGRHPGTEVSSRFILLTTQGSLQPTRANIMNAVEGLAKRAGPHDQFWFAFSGHGLDSGGLSYLVPSDYDGNPAASCVCTRDIRSVIQCVCHAKQKVIVLDACHAGSSRELTLMDADDDATPGFVTFSACGVNEGAYEFEEVGGVFSYYFVRGLAGEADANGDGVVTANELQRYLIARVSAGVRRRIGAVQTPRLMVYEGDGEIPLGGGSPEILHNLPDVTGVAVNPRRKIGPAVFVVLSGTQPGSAAEPDLADVAAAEVRRLLLRANCPVYSTKSPHVPGSPQGSQSPVTPVIPPFGAIFFVRGRVESGVTDSSLGHGLICATTTITADVLDQDGKVIDSINVTSEPHVGVSAQVAAVPTLQDAAARLTHAIIPDLQQALDSAGESDDLTWRPHGM